ncbi:MAG: UvrD-helicase domain-containing protein, partial [Halanaerobiaceae bacterium]
MIKILKASAGTGKTYRLSLEYVNALLAGRDFREIVVMTFTRKATAEIRERIIEHIEDILNKKEQSKVFSSLKEVEPDLCLDTNALQRIYTAMMQDKESIHIYTIDSFINRIFKQAIAPYLDIYNYQIIEDEENEEIIDAVFKKLLDRPADFMLMEKFLTEQTERDIKNYIALIKKMLNNRWKFILIKHRPRKEKNSRELISSLDCCLQSLQEIAAVKGDGFSKDYLVNDYKRMISEYTGCGERELKKDLIIKNRNLFFKKTFWNGRKTRGKAVAPLIEELETKYKFFLSRLADYIYNRLMVPYEQEIFNFSDRVFTIYDRVKFREKAFTHTDISNYSYQYLFRKELNLLAGTDISNYFYELLGTRINSLLIDEFQDTSILQWKILKPVIDGCKNVIIVGDEKQSIYGWRGGEKKLFARLESILEGKSESLLTCYRSEREITGFVNRFFSALEIDWNYEDVNHLEEKDEGYIEILLGGNRARINTETKKYKGYDLQKQQQIKKLNHKVCSNLKQEIADRIRELPVYNNVGVLARSNSDLSDIAVELDKVGIPYILESRDSLIEHEAVKPLYFMLNYINYRDFFQLVKFLRSDLIGISNRSLKWVLYNREQVEEFMADRDIELPYSNLKEIFSWIKKMQKTDYRDLPYCIVEESAIVDRYRENAGALKNIYKFFKLMKNFNSLAAFMVYLEENINNEELKQPDISDENAVSLMTIHKAKGLSFETEFFYWKPGGGSGGASRAMKLFIDFDQNFEEVNDYLLTNSRYEKIFEYLDIDFSEKQREKELMEEINNVYVALTRAEKNLFLYIEVPRKLDPDKDRCWQGDNSYHFYEEALLNGAK